MKTCSRSVILLLWLVAALATAPLTLGQVVSRINGVVQDQTGAVIPGVTVALTDVNRNTTQTTTSNEAGLYAFPNLGSGVYRITAETSGFKSARSSEIRLEVNQTIEFDITMQIGEVTEQIEVTGAAPLLQTEDSQVGGVIENKQVVDFPIQARDFMQLALTVAGVVESTDNNRHQTERATWQGSFSVHGVSADYNQYLLDGMSAKEHQHATNSFAPNLDMIQEIKVETSNYSAEFGSEAGGHINVVTKGGTNSIHGTLFEFNRNSKFGARESFAPTKPFQNRNQYGVVLSGPIVKNKTFWLFSWEDTRLRKGFASRTTVPTAAMKQGDFSALMSTDNSNPSAIPIYDWTNGEIFAGNVVPQSRIHPLSDRFINEFVPDPNRPGDGGIRPVNNFILTDTQKTNSPQLSGRVDHNFTDDDRIFYRFSWSDTSTTAPQVWPAFGYTQDMAVYHTVLNYSKTLSPTSIFEFRAGYSRFNQIERTESAFVRDVAAELGLQGACNANPSCYHAPYWSVQNFSTMGNPSGPTRGQGVSGPRGWKNEIFEAGGRFYMTQGNHNLRMGMDVRKYRDTFPEAIRPAGQHSFNGQWTRDSVPGAMGPPSRGFAMADAMLGLPQRIRASVDIFDPNFSSFSFFPWFQDDWKVTSKLTFNLGLRYEWAGRPSSRNDSISNFLQTGPGEGRIMTPATRPPPAGSDPVFIAAPSEFSRALLHNDNNNFAPRFGFAYQADQKTVVRGAYGLFYQRDNACTWIGVSINAPWIRTGDVRLSVRQEDFEAFPVDDLNPVVNFVTPGSRPSVIAMNVDWEDSYVQQWNLYIDRSLTDSMVAKIGYVGNHALGLRRQTSPFNSPTPGPNEDFQANRPFVDLSSITMRQSVGQSTYNGLELQLEKRYQGGLSFVTAYTFSKTLDNMQFLDVWFGGNDSLNKGPSRLHLSDRFSFSGIYEIPVGRGRPFGRDWRGPANAILGGWDISSIVVLRTGNPLFVTTQGNIANTQSITQVPLLLGDANLDRGDRTWGNFFNTGVFQNPAQFQLGNAGVRPLFGPGNRRWDFAVYKRHRFTEEGMEIQFRAEFFNFTNHPNMGNPSTSFGSASFGQVNDTWSLDNPRETQFGLKFIF